MTLTHADIKRLRRKYRRKKYVKNPYRERAKLDTDTVRRRAQQNAKLLNPHAPKRRKFTAKEIEVMWLGVCRLVDYFGGQKSTIAFHTGFTLQTVSRWIKTGRVSVGAAYVIGQNPDIALTKEELRPEMSKEAWKNYVKSGAAAKDEFRRSQQRFKNAHRIE